MPSKKQKILSRLGENPKNVKFNELCKAAELFGFRFREGVYEMLNFQNYKGMAKPYQVRQFLKIVDKYGLDNNDL